MSSPNDKMKNSRREFIKDSVRQAFALGLLGGFSSLPLNSLAAAADDRKNNLNFILFRAVGGMDSTLGLHPWIEPHSLSSDDLYLTYNPLTDVMKHIGGTEISLGPSAHCLAPFVRKMAIVRGVSMGASDIGHPAALHHIASAKPLDTAPHISAILSQKVIQNDQFLVSNMNVQKTSKQNFATLLTDAFKTLDLNQIRSENQAGLLGLYKKKDLAVQKYLGLLRQKDKMQLFSEIIEKLKQDQSAQPTNQNTYRESQSLVTMDEDIALASFATGLSRVAQIDMVDESRNLDTHANHQLHLEYQSIRWKRIARFLNNLQHFNLFENTIVMVVTEFNRSPGMNSNQGKDHNYTDNAVAIFGGPVNGGKTFGDHQLYTQQQTKSVSMWTGCYFDYAKSKTLNESSLKENLNIPLELPPMIGLIRPENVWASILEKLDPSLVNQIGPQIKTIKGLFSMA